LESERQIRLAIGDASNDSNREPKELDNTGIDSEAPCVWYRNA
jgi:hypothetical protein